MFRDAINRITLIGDDHVEKLSCEIRRRFIADSNSNKPEDRAGNIGRVLFGRSEAGAEFNLRRLGALWAYVENDEINYPSIKVISSLIPVNFLHDFIAKRVSKIDPLVVVVNEYECEGTLLGCRLATVRNGRLRTYKCEEAITDLTLEKMIDKLKVDEGLEDSVIYLNKLKSVNDQIATVRDRVKINAIDKFVLKNPGFSKDLIRSALKNKKR